MESKLHCDGVSKNLLKSFSCSGGKAARFSRWIERNLACRSFFGGDGEVGVEK